ncbi:MAG: recombination-associated protein RdgC [Magnetovibrio sp.]|nr:recombination-associated protein RdgC [Magnetovibrio sp.]
MLFKNARVYRITRPLDRYSIESALQEHPARECQAIESSTAGWNSPAAHNGPLVHRQMEIDMLRLTTYTKVLPAAIVNRMTDEYVRKIEQEQARVVRKRERLGIKDNVIAELLPTALQQCRDTYAYIDYARQLLIINCASKGEAEKFCTALRQALGSLPVTPLTTSASPGATMTHWLLHQSEPYGIEIEGDAVLSLPAEGGTEKATLKNHDLHSQEVAGHLEAHKQVERLRINWQNKISATIDADMTIKSIRFSDIIAEKIADINADDHAERFAADAAIMTDELGELLADLVSAFGGYQVEQEAA